MILIAGIPSEPPVKLLCEELTTTGLPYLLLNQRHFKQAALEWTLSNGTATGALQYEGRKYPLQDFTGVYIRFMDERSLPELKGLPEDHADVKYFQQLHQSLINWMEVAEARVVNRYSAMGSNNSKPYQAQIITQCGFRTPETLITNMPDAVTSFSEKHGDIIYKSISGTRSIVKKIDDADWKRMHKIKNCPVQFQQCVAGFDVRVHVIGGAAIATRIESSCTDYRYVSGDDGYTILSEFDLPDDVHYNCVELGKALALDFCGIDLRFSYTDDYTTPYCFEVNPCPGYSYYQRNTGQNIARVLGTYLGNHNLYYQTIYGLSK